MSRPLAVVILAAGVGSRTKVDLPKVLLPLCGRTLLGTVLDAEGRVVQIFSGWNERSAAALERLAR